MNSPFHNHAIYGKTYSWIQHVFPWKNNLSQQVLEWVWHVDLKSRFLDYWPHLIDTSRFNRALGLSAISVSEKNGRLNGEAKVLGVTQVWQEPPWNWAVGNWLVCEREYSKGFARTLRVIYVGESVPGREGTRLFVYYGWIPRNKIYARLLQLSMPNLIKDYNRVLLQIDASVSSKAKGLFARAAKPISVVAQRRLFSFYEMLQQKGFSEPLLEHLTKTIQHDDDFDVARLQAKRLACEWNTPVDQVLRLFLQATRMGLLTMTWDIVCPHCRGVRSEATHLSNIPKKSFCEVCAIEFGTDQEHAIEVSFHIHSSIREVPRLNYCTAEASSKSHIWLQQCLSPGEKRQTDVTLPTGRYRLRVKGDLKFRELVVHPSHPLHQLEWPSTLPLKDQPPLCLAGDIKVHLENFNEAATTFVLEEETWSEVALKPGEVFYLQEFRDLFSEEYLDAGVMLSIGVQTILFTDIVGSTQFYVEQGDPAAFSLVKKHFNDVFDCVSGNSGMVVKTIGDAVMAAFVKPVDALKAAHDIHAKFPAGRKDLPLRLRVSLHTGPCIAVRLTQNIDYFGGTVNMASKLQALAEAGEIALSAETAGSQDVRSYLQEKKINLESVPFSPKSTAIQLHAFRWNTN